MAFEKVKFDCIKTCQIKEYLDSFSFKKSTRGASSLEVHFGQTLTYESLKGKGGKTFGAGRAVEIGDKLYRYNTSTENCYGARFEERFPELWLECFKALQRVTNAKDNELANLQCNATKNAGMAPHWDDCSDQFLTFQPAALTIVIADKNDAKFSSFSEHAGNGVPHNEEGANNQHCSSDPCLCEELIGTMISGPHYYPHKHGPNGPIKENENPRYSLNFRVVRQEVLDLLSNK